MLLVGHNRRRRAITARAISAWAIAARAIAAWAISTRARGAGRRGRPRAVGLGFVVGVVPLGAGREVDLVDLVGLGLGVGLGGGNSTW